MALSDNAIGFFLEAEDVSLSSTLKTAASNYEKYTKALETYNQRAFESTQSGIGQVQQLVKSVKDLPGAVEQSMKKASGTIQKGLRPISQKVDLAISVSSATKLKKIFGQAVSDAMAGANVRMSASLPQRRMAMFQQGVGLRAQYNDVIQPPDMKGKIKPLKKFAKGGVVEGPAGIDKILALLTKDEMVLPADVSKDLQKMAGGQLKSAGGKFASAKELSTMVSEVENLADALKKMKGGLEAGVGTEKDMEAYQAGVTELTTKVGGLAEAQNDLSFVTKVRLSPRILQATKRLEDFKDEGGETGTAMEMLLGKILGPARFIAISHGIKAVQESLQGLQAGAGSAFSTLGGDAIGNGIDSINQMNQFLGLSRKELLGVKIRAGQVAKEIDGVNFDELAFALKEGAELGIKDQDVLFALARTSAVAAKGLNIAAESATALGFELTGSLNVSQKGFDDVIATMGQLSDSTSGFNIDAGKLFAQTTADVGVLNTALRDMSDTESQRLIGSFNQIGAVLESQFISNAGEIRQTLAKAFEGGPENMEAVANAIQLTGLNQDELKAKLKSGDLEGLFDRIGQQVQGLSPDALKALSSQIGVSAEDLGKFGGSIDDINSGFGMAQTRIVSTGDGLAMLEERARNNRTAWERMQETFTDTVASMSVFGISGAEVLDFFKEFNPLSLLAVAHLGKLGFSALGAMKGFLGMGGAAAQSGGTLAATGGIVSKLGPMLGKLALTAGPILLVGAAVAALTFAAIDSIEKTNAINKETAEKGAKIGLTDFGAVGFDIQKKKKGIAQVQKNIDLDLAAGRGPNESAVRLLERYNGQLAVLEGTSQGMIDEARAAKGLPPTLATNPAAALEGVSAGDFDFDVSNLTQSLNAPVSAAEIAALTGNASMSTGATEEKLDRNNELMEQMVGLMREQVQQNRGGPSPSPAAQGGSTGVSGFGQSVAGGDL